MAIIAYKGRGKTHYSVTKRLDKLNAKLNKLAAKDPNFEKTFKPATTREEFDRLYTKYMTEDAEFTEIKDEVSNNSNTQSNDNNVVQDATETKKVDSKNDINSFDAKSDNFYNDESLPDNSSGYGLDELSTKNVNTRDYVLDRGMKQGGGSNDNSSSNPNNQTNKDFDREPTTWDEAFKIPEPDEKEIFIDENDNNLGGGSGNNNTSSGNSGSNGGKSSGGGSGSGSSGGSKFQKEAPLNSSFDSMTGGKQRRQAKRMAMMAVDVASKLSQIAFEYYCNKDIAHERLIELQNDDIINLDMLLELENGEQAPLRNFFAQQRLRGAEISKWSDDDRDDLVEALTEVLLEKGVALTPMQQLLVTAGSILVQKGFMVYGVSATNKAVIEYATNRNAESKGQYTNTANNSNTAQTEEQPIVETPTSTNDDSDFLNEGQGANLEQELIDSKKALIESTEIKAEDNPFVPGVSVLA